MGNAVGEVGLFYFRPKKRKKSGFVLFVLMARAGGF